jgi:phosphate transport system substrate-binding protein
MKIIELRKMLLALASAILLFGTTLLAQQSNLDPILPPYSAKSGISGNLNSIGSDTLNNLMTFWAEEFKKHYPNVNIQIEGKGSSTAPPALIEGTAQIGPMSRKMKSEERTKFFQKYKCFPLEIPVAIDALAVYVNKDNPIQSLTLEQVDSIFSSTRKRGGKLAATWGDLGLTGEWATKPLSKYGRNSASGTYGFFKEHVLMNGDYAGDVKEQPGSASVVQGIEKDLAGIGYSGIGYRTPGVRPVPIVDKSGQKIEVSYESAASFKYPISRFLYVYVNRPSNGTLAPLTHEFLLYILSKEGQKVTEKDGYFPLTNKYVADYRDSL